MLSALRQPGRLTSMSHSTASSVLAAIGLAPEMICTQACASTLSMCTAAKSRLKKTQGKGLVSLIRRRSSCHCLMPACVLCMPCSDYLATAAVMVADFAPALRQSTAGLMRLRSTLCLFCMHSMGHTCTQGSCEDEHSKS